MTVKATAIDATRIPLPNDLIQKLVEYGVESMDQITKTWFSSQVGSVSVQHGLLDHPKRPGVKVRGYHIQQYNRWMNKVERKAFRPEYAFGRNELEAYARLWLVLKIREKRENELADVGEGLSKVLIPPSKKEAMHKLLKPSKIALDAGAALARRQHDQLKNGGESAASAEEPK